MEKKNKLLPEKGILMISGIAFVFLTTPAWVSGYCAAAVAAVLLCFVIWKLSITREKLKERLSQPAVFALGILVGSACGCNFYNTWVESGIVQKVAELVGLNTKVFVLFCAVTSVLAAAPAVTCVLSYFLSSAIRDFNEKKSENALAASSSKRISAKKALLILFVVYVLGISAILRANFYYQDDAGRAAFGYKAWDYFGRYLSTGLATFVHMGNYLTDIAPLPQILAMLIMAAASVMVLYIVYDRTSFSLWELAAVVPLGLNPYFLECVSFRFDAPYMAMSVLCGILPLLYRGKSTGVYLFASMLGILGVCTSYQAATGIFPILVVLLAVRMWNGGASFKETALFCLKSVAGYGTGLLYFKTVMMKPANAGYVSNALPSAGEVLPNTWSNLMKYYSLIVTDFKRYWLGLILLLAVSFVVLTVRVSKQKKVHAIVLTVLALLMMAMLCFGIYPALADPLFSPRAMYGFGVLIAILGVTAAEGCGNIPAKVPALVLSWAFFVFSFTYGNALSLQKEYTDFRIRMVIEDLVDAKALESEETVRVQISGGIGKSPILDNMPQDYQMLNRLVPNTFDGGDDLTRYQFYYYYDLPDIVEYYRKNLTELDLPVLKDGIYHTISGDGEYVLIELK